MKKDIYKKPVLIVEDQKIIAVDIEEFLNKLGFKDVLLASSGEEAIELALKHKPVLVLMDIVLAEDGLDGVEAANKINKDCASKILFITGQADRSSIEKVLNINPNGLIIKPFEFSELFDKINIAFSK